jgi:hypothetical protein
LGVFVFVIASAPQSPFEHDFDVASQMRPFWGEQSSLKHEHSSVLGKPPPVSVHGKKELQKDVVPVQYRPEWEVHPLGPPPHRQVASLSVLPSVLLQLGAERQRQVLVEEHDPVEVVCVLKSKLSDRL